MKNIKQTLISSVLAASLLVGAGAALAQNDSAAPDAPAIEQGIRGPRGPRNGDGPRGDRQLHPAVRRAVRGEIFDFLSLAEDFTGLTLAELQAGHESGQTLAQLIEANGQSVDDFVTTAVTDISARIDTAVENGNMDADRAAELKASIQEQVTARINGERPIRERLRLELSELVDLIEEYTGLSASEVREAHLSGQTLAELIEANGQSVDAFITAAVTDLNARIDTAVENGNLDADRAADLKATIQERVTARVNGAGPHVMPPVNDAL